MYIQPRTASIARQNDLPQEAAIWVTVRLTLGVIRMIGVVLCGPVRRKRLATGHSPTVSHKTVSPGRNQSSEIECHRRFKTIVPGDNQALEACPLGDQHVAFHLP